MENNPVIANISRLLKEQGKKQSDLTDYLGITPNAFTDWKSGRIKSYTKHLPKIAEFLGVSVEYLVNQKETPYLSSSPDDDMEDTVIYHRDGKTVRKKFSKSKYDAIMKMIEALDDSNPDETI